MNKYVTILLKLLKYAAMLLLIGYLTLVGKILYDQRDEEAPLSTRIENGFGGALYGGMIYIVEFISAITGPI